MILSQSESIISLIKEKGRQLLYEVSPLFEGFYYVYMCRIEVAISK